MTVFIAAVCLYTPAAFLFTLVQLAHMGRLPSIKKKQNNNSKRGQRGCVWETEPIDFHADGWIDQMLLLFLFNSLSIREGQGQSNSHQLCWFFSEIVGQVGAGFVLIRETNGGGHVGGVLGEKFCSYKEWSEGKSQWEKKMKQRGVNIKNLRRCRFKWKGQTPT